MAANGKLEVRFWGVRGGIACPGPETVRYGGNTACIEVDCGGHTLIFDAGTGIRLLGAELNRRAPVEADLFFTQTSFERICGIPFFAAAYHPKNSFRFWGDYHPMGQRIHEALKNLMADPVFPVPMSIMGATIEFNDFLAGETLEPTSEIRVRSASLNHAAPVTGYRIEWRGKVIAYVSDLILGAEGNRDGAIELLDGADMAIVNTTRQVTGNGHWQDDLELCGAAQAKTAVIFHHGPDDDDDALDTIAREVEERRPGTVMSREGLALTV